MIFFVDSLECHDIFYLNPVDSIENCDILLNPQAYRYIVTFVSYSQILLYVMLFFFEIRRLFRTS